MVRFKGKTRLPALVLEAERRIRAVPQGMERMQKTIQSQRDENIRGLATILQQPRHRTGVRGTAENAELLHRKGIDILKDTVSIPGVSIQYLLRESIEKGSDLWGPCEEEYKMLKGAVLGGAPLVFTRHHEVSVTKIRRN